MANKKKLAPSDRDVVRVLYGMGENLKDIATRYGVDYRTVKRAISPEFDEALKEKEREAQRARRARAKLSEIL